MLESLLINFNAYRGLQLLSYVIFKNTYFLITLQNQTFLQKNFQSLAVIFLKGRMSYFGHSYTSSNLRRVSLENLFSFYKILG